MSIYFGTVSNNNNKTDNQKLSNTTSTVNVDLEGTIL